jgi:hypothetical protein
MPTKRRRRRTVEADFLNALSRLKEGKPLHPDLKRRAAAGQLTINPVTVALEAARSRTLIGSDRCRYPHIRELVLQASGRRQDSGVTKADVVEKLRGVIKTLQGDLASARTLLAAQRITIDALSRRA